MAAARSLHLPIVPQQSPRPKLRLVRDPIGDDPQAPAATPASAPAPTPTPTVAIRAMTRFECTGTACEANCCRDWTVAVDAPAYERLERVLSAAKSGPNAPRPEDVLVRWGGAAPDMPFAAIKLKADGTCPLLGDKRTCTLQEQHGEDLLPDACATYPRASLTVGGRREITGRLSCPEVGRLALLTDDGTELVVTTKPTASRPVPGKTCAEGESAWTASFDRVRDAILEVLGRRQMPLALRTVVVADLAARLAPFFYQGSPALEGDTRAQAEERLAQELLLCRDPFTVEGLRTAIAGLGIPAGPAANIVASVVMERTRLSIHKSFDELAGQVLAGFRSALLGDAPPETADGSAMSAEGLGNLWRDRQAAIDARYGDVVDRIFTNWSLLWWMQSPFTDAESLLDHTVRFALGLAIVRFLFAGHPRVAAVLAAESIETAREELEAAAIEVARLFSRAFEHDPKFLKAVDESLRQDGPHTLARALCIASMC